MGRPDDDSDDPAEHQKHVVTDRRIVPRSGAALPRRAGDARRILGRNARPPLEGDLFGGQSVP